MTLDQLRIYVKVIEIGSFTAAAERLDTPRRHVSCSTALGATRDA